MKKIRVWIWAIISVVLLIGILFGIATWGADMYYNHRIQQRYPNEINCAHPMAIDVTMIQLLATPERYDGKLIRVIGVGNLEFEGNYISLSKVDYKYQTGNELWIELGDHAIPYEEARWYNGEYVLVEGIFDKDDHGHMGGYCGAIKSINRYQLWDVYKFGQYRELYTITRNGDGTFSYQFVDQKGNVLFQKDRATCEPQVFQISDHVAALIEQTGMEQQPNDWAVFFDFESGKASDVFEHFLRQRNGYVIYVKYEGGTYRAIVQNIFDQSQYYQEYVLENCSPNAKDAAIGGSIVSNEKVSVTYVCCDGERKELLIQLPTEE